MRPDKAKVVDEIWDEARIRSFLAKGPMGDDENPDFSALLHAYRSMRPDDFAAFIRMYKDAGRDVNATGRAGLTLLETIGSHRRSEPFCRILQEAQR